MKVFYLFNKVFSATFVSMGVRGKLRVYCSLLAYCTDSQIHTLHSVAVVKDDLERMLVEMFVACFKVHSELLRTGPRKTTEVFSQHSRSAVWNSKRQTSKKQNSSATYSTTTLGVTNYVPPYIIMYLSVSGVGLWSKCMHNSSKSIEYVLG
jgi:hypothetical protein